MNKMIVSLAACAALAGCTGSDSGLPRGVRPIANPSAIVAAEYDFAREAQEKGQWIAFGDFAADEAVMFVPEAVRAKDWLKKQTNPARAVTWQPYAIWMSCDGSLAVSKGAWQRPNGTVGYFTTVWQRQRNGDYKWVLDRGDALKQPLRAPEMIQGNVADCVARAPPPILIAGSAAKAQPFNWEKASDDGTLSATMTDDKLVVQSWKNGAFQTVLTNDYSSDE